MLKQIFLFTYLHTFIFCTLLITTTIKTQASPQFLDMMANDWKEFKTENDIMKIKININKSNDYGWFLVMIKNLSANTSYVFQVLDGKNEVPNNIILTPGNIFYAKKSDFDRFETKENLVFITTASNLPKETVIQFKITNTDQKFNTGKYERILYVNKVAELDRTTTNEDTSEPWLNIISTNKATPKDDDWIYIEKLYAAVNIK